MALPIMLNLRFVSASENKVCMALANFSLADSGILFECEYDDKFDAPWGIRIKQVKGGDFGYFTNLSGDKQQKFAEAMSQLINAYYGFDENGKPMPLGQAELPVKLSEEVVTFGEKDGIVDLVPVGFKQDELVKQNLADIPLVRDMPEELLLPSQTQKPRTTNF